MLRCVDFKESRGRFAVGHEAPRRRPRSPLTGKSDPIQKVMTDGSAADPMHFRSVWTLIRSAPFDGTLAKRTEYSIVVTLAEEDRPL